MFLEDYNLPSALFNQTLKLTLNEHYAVADGFKIPQVFVL